MAVFRGSFMLSYLALERCGGGLSETHFSAVKSLQTCRPRRTTHNMYVEMCSGHSKCVACTPDVLRPRRCPPHHRVRRA